MSTAALSEAEPRDTTRTASGKTSPWTFWGAATLLLICLAHAPLVAMHLSEVAGKQHYEYVWIAPFAAAFLAWLRIRELPGDLRSGSIFGTAVAVLAWLGLIVASLILSGWLGAATALLSLAAIMLGWGGWTVAYRLFGAWLILFLAVPLPLNIDRRLVNWLQRFTADWSSSVLDVLGIFHAMSGNVVRIVGHGSLLVEEACSGINSLFTAVFATTFYLLYMRRGLARSVLVLASTVFWVMVANVVRVVFIVVALDKYELDLTEGLKHTIVGLVSFSMAILLIVSTDRFLAFLTPTMWLKAEELRRNRDANRRGSIGDALARLPKMSKTWLGSPLAAVLFLVPIGLQAYNFVTVSDSVQLVQERYNFELLGEDYLPKKVVGYEFKDYTTVKRPREAMDGEFSQFFVYQKGALRATASLDYTFHGWHDLAWCYDAQGWNVTDRTEVVVPDEYEGEGSYVYLKLTKGGQHAAVLFSLFHKDGTPIEPAKRLSWRSIAQAFLDRLLVPQERGTVPLTYQVQLMALSYEPFTETQIKDIAEFFLGTVRPRLSKAPKAPQDKEIPIGEDGDPTTPDDQGPQTPTAIATEPLVGVEDENDDEESIEGDQDMETDPSE